MAIRTGVFGYSFTALRIIELILVGITLGFSASLLTRASRTDAPHMPSAAVVAVIFSTLGCLYLLVTLLLHVSGVVIRYIISTILDIVLCIGLLITAILIGKPLTGLSCAKVGVFNHGLKNLDDALLQPLSRYPALPASGFGGVSGLEGLGATAAEVSKKLGDYKQWVGRSAYWCRLMKVVWGTSIASAILMAVSAAVAWRIWRKVNGIPWLREDDYGVEEDGSVRDGVSVREEVMVQRGDLGEFGLGGGAGRRERERRREREELVGRG